MTFSAVRTFSAHPPRRADDERKQPSPRADVRENIYTIPNVLTLSRILACPVLGYAIVHDHFVAATALLAYAGLTDLVCVPPASCAARDPPC